MDRCKRTAKGVRLRNTTLENDIIITEKTQVLRTRGFPVPTHVNVDAVSSAEAPGEWPTVLAVDIKDRITPPSSPCFPNPSPVLSPARLVPMDARVRVTNNTNGGQYTKQTYRNPEVNS